MSRFEWWFAEEGRELLGVMPMKELLSVAWDNGMDSAQLGEYEEDEYEEDEYEEEEEEKSVGMFVVMDKDIESFFNTIIQGDQDGQLQQGNRNRKLNTRC